MEQALPIEAKRLKKVREEQNHTQQSFAELLGIGATTADIERGKTKLSGKAVMELNRLFNINPLWLYGQSFTKITPSSGGDVSPKIITLTPDEKETIALVNQKAAAGYPHNIQDIEWYETLPTFNITLPQYRNATYRGFQVEGDSMLPNIKPHEWVIGKAVPHISEAPNEKIYVIVMHDSVLVKQLQKISSTPEQVRLISFNPEYPPLLVDVKNIQELWMINSKLSFDLDAPQESNLLREIHQSVEELKREIGEMKKK